MKKNPVLYPIKESEVKIQLQWTADERTRCSIERQARIMGFATPTDYLVQAIACALESNEAMSA